MNQTQRYVSRELTHFVGREEQSDAERYALLVEILQGGQLRSSPTDRSRAQRIILEDAPLSENKLRISPLVCFCDIPVCDLSIHMGKYGTFGLSFLKSYLVPKGATPVFYIATAAGVGDPSGVPNPPELAKALEAADCGHIKNRGQLLDGAFGQKALDALRELTGRDSPLTEEQKEALDQLHSALVFEVRAFMKFFDHEKADADDESFYMEREWRVPGVVDFKLTDVHRVILPKKYAPRLRDEVGEFAGQVTYAD
ncbi:hypothetical protein HQ560_20610 [bacterium]|nr:hypothetical protein [bacterium]